MAKNVDNISKSLNQIIDDKTSDNIKLGEALNDLNYEGVEESILTTLNNKQNKSDSSLATNNKTIVGAINELFLNVDSGKQLIADAIDNPLITGNSTFSAMSEAILDMKYEINVVPRKNNLYNLMLSEGYAVDVNMSLDDLINLLELNLVSPDDVKYICSGNGCLFIVKNDNTVWACGSNGSGQLGLGDTTNRTSFTQITTNINEGDEIIQIECNGSSSYLLKSDGVLLSTGNNGNGRLGLGDTTNRNTFTQCATNVKQVGCGSDFSIILKNDGTLWGCGASNIGQIGLGSSYNDRTSYTKITTNATNIKEFSCGGQNTLVLKNDGTVWGFGYNHAGGLGNGGALVKTTLTQSTNATNVKAVSCGDYHSAIIKNDGSLWTTGWNNHGQLGFGTINTEDYTFKQVITNIDNDVKQVVCGTYCTIIMKTDGTIWSCGNNANGQLGLGNTNTPYKSFTQVTTNVNNDIAKLACRGSLTLALKTDGSLWGCGNNSSGQLNVGDTENKNVLTLAYKPDKENSLNMTEEEVSKAKLYDFLLEHNPAVTNTMTLDELIQSIPEKDLLEDARRRLVSLLSDGGYNIAGTEDIDDLIDLLTVSGIYAYEIKQICCGHYHNFVLKNDGTLWGCGLNNAGQLGLGDTNSRNVFTLVTTNTDNIKNIYCGANSSFIIKNDNSLWSCGVNDKGQLGLGNTTNRSTFTKVTTNVNNDVKQVASRLYHTLILKTDGSVWSCGYNFKGQLGLGSYDGNAHSTFTKVTTNINNDVKQVACGDGYSYILKKDGSVWSCGYNSAGQLGLGNTTMYTTFTKVTTNVNNDVKEIICGGDWNAGGGNILEHVFILKNDGSILGTGYNANGQLGLGDTTNRTTFTKITTNVNNDVKQVACGSYHTFILKNDGSIWACGSSTYGQLGLGNTGNKTTFTQVTTNINNDVKQIACGHYHTFVLKNDGSIWATGYNNNYQLGLSDNNYRDILTAIPKGFSY